MVCLFENDVMSIKTSRRGERQTKQSILMGKNGRKSTKNRKHMATGEFQECAMNRKSKTDTSSPLRRMSNDVFHSWHFEGPALEMGTAAFHPSPIHRRWYRYRSTSSIFNSPQMGSHWKATSSLGGGDDYCHSMRADRRRPAVSTAVHRRRWRCIQREIGNWVENITNKKKIKMMEPRRIFICPAMGSL